MQRRTEHCRAQVPCPSLVFASSISAFGGVLPSLTVTPVAIEAAVVRAGVVGRNSGRIIWQPDEQVQRIVQSWPRRFTSRRARELGLAPDDSADAIVRAYLEDCLPRA